MSKTTITLAFEMGDTVRDVITGMEGVVTGFTTFITGCDQYCVTPRAKDGDNDLKAAHWFDVTRLEAVAGTNRVVLPDVGKSKRDTGAGTPPPATRR